MAHSVNIGDVIAEKYRVERILGQGAMGMVVAAYHRALDQTVALKFMRSASLAFGEASRRFQREAKAVARLRSENIARVMDVGQMPDGSLYMVMEYVEGIDLASLVEQRGPLALEDAVDYLLQTCAGVTEAHQEGIIHRDLKPAHLYLTRRPTGAPLIKILDFGISKYRPRNADPMQDTDTFGIVGSPPYMSPEQAQSAKSADERSDIWSLGIILYFLLSGKLPFWADSVAEILAKILCDPHPPLREHAIWVPPGLEAVVNCCLSKEPEKRFDRVTLLAASLTPFASAKGRALVDSAQIPVSSAVPVLPPADFDPSLRNLFSGPTQPVSGPDKLDLESVFADLRRGESNGTGAGSGAGNTASRAVGGEVSELAFAPTAAVEALDPSDDVTEIAEADELAAASAQALELAMARDFDLASTTDKVEPEHGKASDRALAKSTAKMGSGTALVGAVAAAAAGKKFGADTIKQTDYDRAGSTEKFGSEVAKARDMALAMAPTKKGMGSVGKAEDYALAASTDEIETTVSRVDDFARAVFTDKDKDFSLGITTDEIQTTVASSVDFSLHATTEEIENDAFSNAPTKVAKDRIGLPNIDLATLKNGAEPLWGRDDDKSAASTAKIRQQIHTPFPHAPPHPPMSTGTDFHAVKNRRVMLVGLGLAVLAIIVGTVLAVLLGDSAASKPSSNATPAAVSQVSQIAAGSGKLEP